MGSGEKTRLTATQAPRMLFDLLDRGAKGRLLAAAVVSGALALLETVAILTVLPLVQLATGVPLNEGTLGWVWHLLGEPERGVFGLLLVGLVVGLFIVKDLGTVAFQWWQLTYLAQQKVTMSTRIFRSIMGLEYDEFRTRPISESLTLINSAVTTVFGSLVGGLMGVVTAGLSVLAVLAALFMTTPVQALLAIVYFGAAAVVYSWLVRPRLAKAGELILGGSIEMTLAGMQGLHGFKEIALRHSAEHFISRFTRGMALSERGQVFGGFFGSATKYLLEILFILGVGGLLVYEFATSSPSAAVSSLALFVAAGFRLLPNISGLISAVNGIRTGYPALSMLHAAVNDVDERVSRQQPDTQPPVLFSRDIALRNVHFRYPGAHSDALRGVDLTIPFGCSVAFVGGSGAGKTTLVDVVLGLHTPTEGTIEVDGHSLVGRMRSWQEQCSMVAQDVFLTQDSIRQNIVFDMDQAHADPERLERAVHDAQLQDVIASLPEGLDSSAGDWGNRLSGGQRQRVGIARALYRSPRLLVLDEATSALDNETERKITDTIAALHGSITVLVVAHRLSTVKNVDMIVMMKDGKVEAVGGFEELQQRSPDFARLVELGRL